MSVSTPATIIGRIKEASPLSPIAVFQCHVPGMLNAVFASTVATRELINNNAPGFIGVYDRNCDLAKVKKMLEEHAK